MKWREDYSFDRNELKRLAQLAPNEVLRVPADASTAEITRAFRRLIKVYHPDRAHPFMRLHNQEVCRIIISAYRHLLSRHGTS
jgi:DnaJ-class molecular chaperone